MKQRTRTKFGNKNEETVMNGVLSRVQENQLMTRQVLMSQLFSVFIRVAHNKCNVALVINARD